MAQTAQTSDFRVRKGLVVENTATVLSVTGTIGTNSGAIQVVGGVGIGGGLFVGASVTATSFVGALTGNVTGTATSANNLTGGSAGSIPIQSAAGTTAFIPQGTTGYVLTAAAGNTATWQALSGLSAGTATNAINIQTQAQIANSTYYPTFVSANSLAATYQTEYTTSSFYINAATGAINVGGSLQVAGGNPGGVYIGTHGQMFDDGNFHIHAIGDGNLWINNASTTTNTDVRINNQSTGSVILTNGVGNVRIISTQSSNSATSGALQVTGGVGIGGGLFVGATVTSTNQIITGVTSATTTVTGALQVAGGVGIGNNVIVGGYGQFAGAFNENTTQSGVFIGISGSGTPSPRAGFFNGNTAQNWEIDNYSGTFRWFTPGVTRMQLDTNGNLSVYSTTGTTSASSGALQVAGGVGVGGGLFVSGIMTSTSGLSVTSTNAFLNIGIGNPGILTYGAPNSSGAIAQFYGSTDANLYVGTKDLVYSTKIGANSTNGYITVTQNQPFIIQTSATTRLQIDGTGITTIYSTAVSTSTATGALIVAGGAGIGGTLYANAVYTVGTVTSTNHIITGTTPVSSTNTGALQVAGGVGIGGSVYVGGVITATTFFGVLTGTATLATTATNLTGGTAGSIPIQSAAGTTAYIPIGTSGQILYASGSTATWVLPSGLSAGSSTTATNLAGGTAGSIPYQVSPGSTGFSSTGTTGQLLQSNGLSAPSYTSNPTVLTLNVSSTLSSTSSYSSNALYVAGGIGGNSGFNINGNGYLNGNLQVNGVITATSVIFQNLVSANSGTFYGDSTGNGALYAGVTGYVPFPQTMIQATGNLNNYMEVNVQNINPGAKASTDIVASADNVSLSSAYIDMGIASSTFDGTQLYSLGQTVGPNDGYLMVGQNATAGLGDLVFGTLTSGTQMRFVLANGITTTVTNASVAMFVNPPNSPASSASSGTLVVVGGLGVSGGAYISGVLTATNYTSPTSMTFNVNNTATSLLLDANSNILLGGATSVLNSVVNGSVVQLGNAGTALTGVANPFVFFNGKYSTAAGVPQYAGIWASGGYWGVGPDTNASDNTVRIGNVTGGATGYQWAASYANLKAATINATGLNVNGVVTATTFYGTFIGTLSTIVSTASSVVTQVTNAAGSYYPTFVSVLNTSTNIGQIEYTTSSFSINPSNGNINVTGVLTATNLFVGPWAVNTSTFSGSAGSANTASTIITQASNTTANYYPTFVSGNNLNTTTSQQLFTTSSFFVNATSGVVTMGSVTSTNQVITGVTSATSTQTGALIVAGGVGVGGSLYAGAVYANGTQLLPNSIQSFTATAGQTTFAISGGYVVGQVQVFVNGLSLNNGTDFTASNGSSIVLTIPRNLNDVVQVISQQTFNPSGQQAYSFNQYTSNGTTTTFATSYNTATVQVFQNGTLQSPTSYTANNGTSIIFSAIPTNGTVIGVVSFNSVSITNAISSSGGTINGNLNVTGSLQQNGQDITALASAMAVVMGI